MKLALTLLISTFAYAADDGPILINQARALAGSITDGDEPGFPVTISQPGSYRLTGNLTAPDNTSAIVITTNSVTIDLNGFSIIGPNGCSSDPTVCPPPGNGFGIQAGDPRANRNVRVTNGTVRGMSAVGIQLNGDGSSVDRVTVVNNANVGMNVQGIVTSSTATRNGFGILALSVRDSSAIENAGDGIVLYAGGTATGNTSSANGGVGIHSPYGTVTGNTLFLNKGSALSAFCPSVIANNTMVSTGAAIFSLQRDGCAFLNNAQLLSN